MYLFELQFSLDPSSGIAGSYGNAGGFFVVVVFLRNLRTGISASLPAETFLCSHSLPHPALFFLLPSTPHSLTLC